MSRQIALILSGTSAEADMIEAVASALLYYISPFLFVLLYFVLPSPYGKLATPAWDKVLGPSLPAKWAWFLFELPNLIWAVVTAWQHYTQQQDGSEDASSSLTCNYILYAFFVLHYIRRDLIYPLQLSPRASPTPAGVILNAMAYTTVNG